MLQISIDPELERTLAAIAERTGQAPGEIARHALVAYLDELEEYARAVEAWKANDPSENLSSEDMLRALGVED